MTQVPEYTRQAAGTEQDFPGWLAVVLATVAKDLPQGPYGLIAGRPGSWEAEHVERLAETLATFDLT